ncbi:unnamed protein product, partial [Meganyctiphanes norvegica]
NGRLLCRDAGGSCLATSRSCRTNMKLEHAYCSNNRVCCSVTEKNAIGRKTTKGCKRAGGICKDMNQTCSTVRRGPLCVENTSICCLRTCKTKQKCIKQGGHCKPKGLGCKNGHIFEKGCKNNCICCIENTIRTTTVAPATNCGIANLNQKKFIVSPGNENVRIFDGQPVKPPNKYPWMVWYTSPFCAGIIISNEYILTAAHCVDGTEVVTVTIADHDLNSEEDDIVGVTRQIR